MPKPILLPLLAAGFLTASTGGVVVVTPEVAEQVHDWLPGGNGDEGEREGTRNPGEDDAGREESREEAEAETERLFQEIQFTGPANVVHAINRRNGHFEMQGSARYVGTRSDLVAPGNEAFAYSSCTDCQTLALALQLTVYQEGANVIRPLNVALAMNEQCTRCLTIARAIQYVIPVPDVKAVPRDVRRLVQELDRELQRLEKIDKLDAETAAQVEASLNDIIARFDSLRVYVEDKRDVETTSGDGTPTVTPSAPPDGSTLTPTPAVSETPATTPQLTPTVTPAPSTATPSGQ